MSFKIYPYKVGSASVRALKEALDAVIIKREGSRYRQRQNDVVINWGSSTEPTVLAGVDVLNDFSSVALAANKLHTLSVLDEAGLPTVPFTENKDEAEAWGSKVFVRHNLSGHSGDGIEVVEPTHREQEEDSFIEDVESLLTELAEDAETPRQREAVERMVSAIESLPTLAPTVGVALPDAPLYTKAVANNGEYRVHVMGGEVILYQKKSRRVDDEGNVVTAEGSEADVRNLASNWIYRTGNLNRLERIEELAINAIEALGLDFGAVDIIKDTNGDVFILEVNTAPGLGNTETLRAYTEGFNNLVN